MAERNRLTRHELSLLVQNKNLKALLEENSAFRKFIWTLFTDAGIFYPTYSHRSPYDTAYQEGRRSVGLEVLHMLKHVRSDILSIIEREGNLLEREIKAAEQSTPEDAYAPPSIPDDDEPYDPQP